MTNHRAIWITSGLVFAFLLAQAQDIDWYKAVNAGTSALEKRECAVAEKAFQEALTSARKLQHGENHAQFSTALLLAAQACGAQGKREAAEAEMFAQRAAGDMDQALHDYRPGYNSGLFHRSELGAALFDEVGHIFADHQKPVDAEKFYQRVIQLHTAAVQAHASLERDLEKETQLPGGNEKMLYFVLLDIADPRGKLAAANKKLAIIYFGERKFAEAAEAYEAALKIEEDLARVRPSDGLKAADERYIAQHKGTKEAEDLQKSRELQAAGEHAAQGNLAVTLSNLASCYAAQAKYDKAEPLYQRALALFEKAAWMEKPEALSTIQLYALLLRKTGREEEANALLQQAAKKTGP